MRNSNLLEYRHCTVYCSAAYAYVTVTNDMAVGTIRLIAVVYQASPVVSWVPVLVLHTLLSLYVSHTPVYYSRGAYHTLLTY